LSNIINSCNFYSHAHCTDNFISDTRRDVIWVNYNIYILKQTIFRQIMWGLLLFYSQVKLKWFLEGLSLWSYVNIIYQYVVSRTKNKLYIASDKHIRVSAMNFSNDYRLYGSTVRGIPYTVYLYCIRMSGKVSNTIKWKFREW
jgi:hypothetical protein